MADDKVTLIIDVDSKDAQDAIEKFGATAVKSVKKTESAFESMSSSIKGVGATLKGPFLPLIAVITTVTSAFSTISSAIDEAAKDSLQLKQLDAALKSTGEGGQEAVEAIVAFADSIKNATGLSDDLVKSAFLTAKSFGTTTEEAKKLTEAAVDLAAATGIDVDTAVRQLGGTLDGSIGKVANLGSEFRNLSTEQLKSGEAIDLVASKYKGAGAAGLDTFAGATSTLSNSIDDLLKAFGKAITESDAIVNAIRRIAEAINYTAEVLPKIISPLGEYQKQLDAEKAKKFVDQIELVGNKSEGTAPKVGSLVEQLSSLNQSSTSSFKTFGESLNKINVQVEKSSRLTGKQAEEARKKFDDLLKTIVDAGKTELEIAARVRDERLKIAKEGFEKGAASEREYAKARQAILKEYSLKESKILSETEKERQAANDRSIALAEKEAEKLKKSADEARQYIENISKDPFKFVFSSEFKGSAEEWGAFAAGVFNQALDGKSGAIKALSATAGAVASAVFGPAFGPVVESIFGKLTAGKDQAKEFIKEFISSIPEIIEAVVESIPAVIEGVIEVFSRPSFWIAVGKALISALTVGLIPIVEAAISRFTAGVGPAVLNAFSQIYSNITNAVVQAFQRLGGVFDGVIQAFRDIFNTLIGAFEPLTNALNSLKDVVSKITGIGGALGGGGGPGGVVGSVVGGVGKALGFAKGGLVYAADGFVAQGTDTVPAMLTPGELVVPTDLVGQLAAFLSTQSATGGASKSDAILMAILQAVQQPVTVNSQVKVNQSAFADIILQLNRQNARLTA